MTAAKGRPDTSEFLPLFLTDIPLLDTRAPVEFNKGSFPNAVNLPLMTDEERELVGTCYKQQGQDAAITLGHSLVSGEIKAARVKAWQQFAEQHPEGYLYCFRGGLRSQTCQQWMQDMGTPYPKIQGGYKAMRRFLIDSSEDICRNSQFVVLAGQTGAAKTEILKRLPTSVDLEELAKHRGSAFGKRVGGQPSQINFENSLAVELLRQRHRHPGKAILLEDESRLIGRCLLPMALQETMKQCPLVFVDVDLESRVEHSFHNYILLKLDDWVANKGEEQGFQCFADELRQSFKNIRKRLGGQRYSTLSAILEQALEEHQRGDNSLHRQWISRMLAEYYDPLYNHHAEKKKDRTVFRGDVDQVSEYLLGLA
jgi:tRNA 2-selenouridine synthase